MQLMAVVPSLAGSSHPPHVHEVLANERPVIVFLAVFEKATRYGIDSQKFLSNLLSFSEGTASFPAALRTKAKP